MAKAMPVNEIIIKRALLPSPQERGWGRSSY
jgi:hypothetical protein